PLESRRVLARESTDAVDDPPEEPGQDASRPHLDEGRSALGGEAADTVGPPDGARDLLEEEGLDLRRGAGHTRVDVAHHREHRIGDRDPVELAGEPRGGGRHEGAVGAGRGGAGRRQRGAGAAGRGGGPRGGGRGGGAGGAAGAGGGGGAPPRPGGRRGGGAPAPRGRPPPPRQRGPGGGGGGGC